MDFIKLYTKVAYKFTGKPQRENIYEYPLEAIREAVINSVMHKNYFEKGHNNILKFFPDKIQIENVWIKPKHFILGKTIFRRNRIIADLFSRIHFGEKLGSGMKRIKEYCKNEKAPFPKIEFTDDYFYITFKPSESYIELATKKKTTLKTTLKTEEKILNIIKQNPRITKENLASQIGVTIDGIKYHIKKLSKKDAIKWFGPTKGGHWKVKEGEKNEK